MDKLHEDILDLNKKVDSILEIIEESNLELTADVKTELTERRTTPKSDFVSQEEVEKKSL